MLKKFKPWEDLTFTDDYMFKLLIERKRICKGTLNAFLDWNIRSITYFATEKPLQAGYATKGVRLDETSMRTIKRRETERKSYMTYIMKMREERQDAFDEGKAKERDLMFRIYDMLSKHLPYQDIARATQTSVEDVRQIAERFGIAY